MIKGLWLSMTCQKATASTDPNSPQTSNLARVALSQLAIRFRKRYRQKNLSIVRIKILFCDLHQLDITDSESSQRASLLLILTSEDRSSSTTQHLSADFTL